MQLKQDILGRWPLHTMMSVLNATEWCVLKWLVLCCVIFTSVIIQNKNFKSGKIYGETELKTESVKWKSISRKISRGTENTGKCVRDYVGHNKEI